MENRPEPQGARILGWLLIIVPAAGLFVLVAWIISWRSNILVGIISALALGLWALFIGRHRASWMRRAR